ncbi:galactose oxidase early set domain-containing protein [Agromyces bauzanensis]|uniref:DUF1929 domain-containing protein n=1 Tax=Agromyces bauzanensis TaxID=1308924 RepID=A0A917UN78_9MICO|nr:galactose oxidase early set domain-containing protein [Agromyces bauzanensis]GGJ69815.1 hypothetical protein GCM10011372_04600 [Agromyces bauzanensis]
MLTRPRRRRAGRFGVLAAVTAAACLLGTGVIGLPPALAAAENLVANPSLEAGDTWPECFSPSGWGTEAAWTASAGRTGERSISLTISGHAEGDRKLLQTETPACAPSVDANRSYSLSVWYLASATVHLTVFRHSDSGWSYWGDFGAFAPTGEWADATATTPPLPDGTDRLVFGLSLATDGTVTTDDYRLADADPGDPPATPVNLVANPHLAEGDGVPNCFMEAGWGEQTGVSGISDDTPAGAPAGSRSFAIELADRLSGDRKLLQSEATGCAPTVEPGRSYDVAVDYRSSSEANGLTVFAHTPGAGWAYWNELASLPETDVWTTAHAATQPVPAGVDRLSFGISISAPGTLATTGYSLAASPDQPEPTPTPTADPTPSEPPGPGDPQDPAIVGEWEVLASEMPLRTIHTTLLHDGRLLLVAGSGNDGTQFAAGTFRAVVWDPVASTFTEIPTPYDMFCAGHVTLPDGKVLLAGGTGAFPEEDQGPNTFKGSRKSYYFDPADDAFHATGEMAGAHWYPSLTKLGDGDIWSAGGLDEKAEGTVLTEIFDTSELRWLSPGEVPQTWSFWGTYPHMYLLEDGMLFYAGAHTFGNGLPGTGASLYDWRTAQIWDVPGLREKDLRDQAGSVLLPPAQDQRVMIVGGGNTDANLPATSLVDIIDLSVPSPGYEQGPDLPGPGKGYVNVLNLPDRTVLAANGARLNRAEDVHTAAIYDPVANAWRSVAADPIGRNYHSTAILLPDGRVAVFGSNPADNSFELRISVYSPPYLFGGARPTIEQAPGSAAYGESLELQVTGDVASAALMSPMSATHQTDTNARLVDLPITGTGDVRTAEVPQNANLLPPGPYMLTVLDTGGVPSVAKWVWIS